MKTPKVSVVETKELQPGDFAIFHRGGFEHGLPCIAATKDGSTELRLVPLNCPWQPQYALAAMHESGFGGVAVRIENALLEVDFASASRSSSSYSTAPADALFAAGGKFYLPMRAGQFLEGYLDLKTGMISPMDLEGAWIAFARWRVVDGGDPAVQLFASQAWESDDNDRQETAE